MVQSYLSGMRQSVGTAQLYIQRHILLVIAVVTAIVLALIMSLVWINLQRSTDARTLQLEIDQRTTPEAEATSPQLREKPLILNFEQNATDSTASPQPQKSPLLKSPNASSNNSVHINGTHIAVPKNGEVHREIRSNNGKTTIDISVQSNSSTSNDSSLDLNVQSSTESTRQTGQ